MTLIMALNLTDRVILAGDTKVTNSLTKNTLGYALKVLQFSDSDGSFVSCAFAGNKHFIMYLAGEIQRAIERGGLNTDINELLITIASFFKKVVPTYPGKDNTKKCFMIFAGVSKNPNLLKAFDADAFSEILGGGPGKIEDENLLFAMQTGFKALPCREQRIFSFEINSTKNIFGIGNVGGVYSFIFGGSTQIEPGIQKQIRKIFLDKRKIEDEAKDVINLLRGKYSDTIGGAINIGFIDQRGVLSFVGYEVDRKGKPNDVNWSTKYNDKIIAVSPTGEEYDLVKGFHDPMPASFSLDEIEL